MKFHLTHELNNFPGRFRRDSGQNTVRHPEPMSPRNGQVGVEGALLCRYRREAMSKDPATPYSGLLPPHGLGIAHKRRTTTLHRAIGGAP
jgi:hypothetical protein